jgi:predicted phosphodiesterase
LNRVAVITDIHGNLPALEASLDAIDAIGVDEIYCGGDLVGYGPYPNEVCALIEEREIPTIYGNYDYAIGRDLDDCGCAYVTQHDRELGQRSVAWTLAHTDERAKDFMRGLPFDLRFDPADVAIHLVHGSPPPRKRGCSCSGIPTGRGFMPTAGCCSSTAGRSASRRTATRAARSRSLSSTRRVRCRSRSIGSRTPRRRSPGRSRRPGSPGEYAVKLVAAA